MLSPIFSYDGTGAWISFSTSPSLVEGSNPAGWQHTNATARWPSFVFTRRNISSSTVSPRILNAWRGSRGGRQGKVAWVTWLRTVLPSVERENKEKKQNKKNREKRKV